MSRLLTTEFNSPLVDPKTGKIAKEWMRKFAGAYVLEIAGATYQLAGPLEISGAGLDVDLFLLIDPGTSNTLTFLANAGAGHSNPLVQAGDQVLIFQGNGVDTGNFVLGIWSASAKGIRITSAGRVGIGKAAPGSTLAAVGLPVFANNAAAITGGLTAGDFYRTGGDPDLVCVVH